MMDAPETERADEIITRALSGRVSAIEVERLRAQLAAFRAKLGEAERPSRRVGTPARRARWGLGITLAAGVAATAIVGLLLWPHTSFADVAAAVAKQPWIHVRQVHAGVTVGENWYSPSREIAASRSDEVVEYHDYRLQVYYSYNSKEQVLDRSTEHGLKSSNYFPSMVAAMTVLLQQERTLDKPLDHLDFLDQQREKMKVLDQDVSRVTEDGHSWLDYRMTVSHPESTEPMRMLFRVDAATKLPQLCRTEGHWKGEPATYETRFDYPETGPADVYDLGVPKTARLVDHVPVGDLKRIWETLKAGRERMDNYRAVFVIQSEHVADSWWTEMPVILYRKGDKYRADYVSGATGDLAAVARPAGDEDPGKWWRERVKFFRFYPQYVLRDSTLYVSDKKYVTDLDGSEHAEIVSVKKFDDNTKPGETLPPEYSMRPEFICRTVGGVGNKDFEPVLDMNPTEGPAGCILLSVRHTTEVGRINDKGVGLPDEQRFWLDPQRDYIAMRWDMVTRDAAGEEETIGSFIVEQVARSPQGVWYATQVRRKDAVGPVNGQRFDQIYHIYVDFDVSLPDTLFDPPVPGRVH